MRLAVRVLAVGWFFYMVFSASELVGDIPATLPFTWEIVPKITFVVGWSMFLGWLVGYTAER